MSQRVSVRQAARSAAARPGDASMKLSLEVDGAMYRALPERAVSLAIPLDFRGAQPGFFGAAPARSRPMKSGGFVGAVTKGGSCNAHEIRMNVHCNGTHTETVGHVLEAPVPIGGVAIDVLAPALLVSGVDVGGLPRLTTRTRAHRRRGPRRCA